MSRHRTGHHVARLAALAATLTTLACGGGDSADTADPGAAGAVPTKPQVAALAKRAFGANRAARSGRIDGTITITVTGLEKLHGYAEPVEIGMSGPFHYRAGAALPDYALDLHVRNQGLTLSSVKARSFLTLIDTSYELPADVRRRLVRTSAKGRNGLMRVLEQFGIAPWRWEIDKRIAAVETVNGARSVRVDTGVDIPVFLRDANTLAALLSATGIARANGLPATLPRRARSVLAESVVSAKGSSWLGLKDAVMHKAGLTIRFKIPAAKRRNVGGIKALTVVAQMNVTDVGTAQQIAMPTKLQPFSSLALALDALGDFEDAQAP